MIVGLILLVGNHTVGAEVKFKGREPATLQLKGGVPVSGELIELNSKQVRFRRNGNVNEYDAEDVKSVKTRTDTFTYDSKTRGFRSQRGEQEAKRAAEEKKKKDDEKKKKDALLAEANKLKAAREAELKKCGQIVLHNQSPEAARVVLKAYRNLDGSTSETQDGMGFVVAALEPGERKVLRYGNEPYLTSLATVTIQIGHRRIEKTFMHTPPNADFVIVMTPADVPPPLPISFGNWEVRQSVNRSTRRQFVSRSIGGGLTVTDEVVTPTEEWARSASAVSVVKNPTSRAVEATVVVEFSFAGPNFKGEREVRVTRTIPANAEASLTASVDCQFPGFLFDFNAQAVSATLRDVRVKNLD